MGEEFQKMLEVVIENDRLCDACIYRSEGCDGGIHGGPNGPVYPLCADKGPESCVDEDKLKDVYDEIVEEEKQ